MSKVLHTDEMISNVVLFMIAGYETTATSLAYPTYILATQPDLQEKLVEEINEKTWNNNEADELYSYAKFFVCILLLVDRWHSNAIQLPLSVVISLKKVFIL
jgi:cytochrome P450